MGSLDGILILICLYLTFKTDIEYRAIAFAVLAYLVISDVTYNYLFIEIRQSNNWLIYTLYNLINLFTLYNLEKFRAHLVIRYLIFANILLNVAVSFYFTTESIGESVYNMYPYLASCIAIMCVMYVGILSVGIKYLGSNFNNRSRIASHLLRRRGIYHRSSL